MAYDSKQGGSITDLLITYQNLIGTVYCFQALSKIHQEGGVIFKGFGNSYFTDNHLPQTLKYNTLETLDDSNNSYRLPETDHPFLLSGKGNAFFWKKMELLKRCRTAQSFQQFGQTGCYEVNPEDRFNMACYGFAHPVHGYLA